MEKLYTLKDEIKPIYLGYETKFKRYYFYALKDKLPRFLVFCNYFYWGIGPQTALVLIELPIEVERDLESFLTGRLEYEFRKLRKNSKTTTAHRIYRDPQEVSPPDGKGNSKTVKAGSSYVEEKSRSTLDAEGILCRTSRNSSNSRSTRRGKQLDVYGEGGNLPTQLPINKRHRRTKQEMQEARIQEISLICVPSKEKITDDKAKTARAGNNKNI
jgi:hypothetical protein